MTRLGIVVALAAEARTLGVRSGGRDEISVLPSGVMACVAGIGGARAHSAAERLLRAGANALLSWGTAAALSPELAPGQVLLPGLVLSADGSPTRVSAALRRQLHRRLATRFSLVDQALISTNEILAGPADKQRIFGDSAAVAADMESAAVADAAVGADVPFAALRVVADAANTRVPSWIAGEIDEYGRLRGASTLSLLIRHPDDWFRLGRLAVDFYTALRVLRAIFRSGCCADLERDRSEGSGHA